MRRSQLVSHKCWIHGEAKSGGAEYPLVNPSNGEVFAHAVAADAHLVDSALRSAQRSLRDWRRVPAYERAAMLHSLAELVRNGRDELASLLSQEVGKPLQAALDEVISAASHIDYFAEESLRLTGEIPLLAYRREQVLIVREPVGVVVTITPFNYPLSTLVTKIAPALAVGCTVVSKPDEHTPLSTLRLARLAIDAGMPPGVFNVVTGPGPGTGSLLIDHPIPRLIAFTGSTAVGKEIHSACAKWVRKTVLELGGHCPAIVCKDAAWRELLPQLLSQSLKNCGQYCYRISRIYVERKIHGDFLEAFVKLASLLRIGPAMDSGVELGPLNNEKVLDRVRRQVAMAVEEGAHVEIGGDLSGLPRQGFFYPPTVLTGVKSEMAILREEIFGPVVIISSFDDIQDAITEANATPYGLAAYLFTKDLANALAGANELEVGSVWINRIHQAYPEAPFGGMKESGLGREKSRFGIEEYTELKTVYLSY